MDLGSIPLFAMLRERLGYLNERQRVVSQNVANSDTPGFTPSDLKPFAFTVGGPAPLAMAKMAAVTQPNHMAGPAGTRRTIYKANRTKDSETTLDGNSVVLEEEMLKMAEARMSYDAAISFYQKSLNMIRLASRGPGR